MTPTWPCRHALDEAGIDGLAGEQRAESVQVELGTDLGGAAMLGLVHRQIVDQRGIAQQGEGTSDAGVNR